MKTHRHTRFFPLRLFAILLITLLLGACSHVNFLLQSKPDQVATLIEQQRFYPALDLIDATPRDDPDYARLTELRSEVLTAISRYESDRLKVSAQLIASNDLSKALQTVEEALSHVPASKKLLQRRSQVQRSIERHTAATELALAQLRAETLPREIALLEKMQRYSADTAVADALQNKRSEADTARNLLIAETKRLIKKGEMDRARHNASLAHTIHAGKDSRELLNRIDGSIQQDRLKRLRRVIESGDLRAAKQIAATLDGKSPEERALLDSLNGKVHLEVSRLIREGQHAYTKGNLDKAITQWEQALQLDPDNGEIKTLLQRARTFKTNYQRFKGN